MTRVKIQLANFVFQLIGQQLDADCLYLNTVITLHLLKRYILDFWQNDCHLSSRNIDKLDVEEIFKFELVTKSFDDW